MGVCFGLAKDHEVVRVSHQGARPIELAPGPVFDPEGLFHAVERNVGQQRRNHTALRRARLGLVQRSHFHIARLEPLRDQFPGRERADGIEQRRVADVVKGTFDVSVQDPSLALVGARDGINPGDGIMASPTGTEAVAGAFKPGLPEWFQSVLHDRLHGTIDHGCHMHFELHSHSNNPWDRLRLPILSILFAGAGSLS